MVKLALESEARIVSMTLPPCLPVPPSTRMGLGEVMVGGMCIQEMRMWYLLKRRRTSRKMGMKDSMDTIRPLYLYKQLRD